MPKDGRIKPQLTSFELGGIFEMITLRV